MEQVAALTDRIRALKTVAASMHEGTIHTQLIPEIDKILALPEELHGSSVGELEAVTRQVREYEQTFDRMGYTLLDQLMPATGESPVFQVVRAAETFKTRLRRKLGRSVRVGDGRLELDAVALEVLTRYSLSIGTPPVTQGMRELVARTLLGRPAGELAAHVETLDCEPVAVEQLLGLLGTLVESSLHYNTAAEETEFLREAAEFVNCEGARLFNRAIVTESPERVIELVQNHVFDKAGPQGASPVRLVDGVDKVDAGLMARMQIEPNAVFVARVTRIPHRIFVAREGETGWASVLGRLILIDDSTRARQSNTTIVYTLFPHVARTLRNVQVSFAGRPANTQLQLRRILERVPPRVLSEIRQALDQRLASLVEEGVRAATVEEIRAQEWRRNGLFDYLALAKLARMVRFLEEVATSSDRTRHERAEALRREVAEGWMRYFYKGLPPAEYRVTVLPGGGRGALTLVGEYHREAVRRHVEEFRAAHLESCRQRVKELKSGLQIPDSSTDEIQAAIKQSQVRALSPTQWKAGEEGVRLSDHVARTMVYRAADAASKMARLTREGVDKAAFGNVTGGAAALLKRAMSEAGLGALHGRLEELVGDKVGRYDRRLRDVLTPVQELVRTAQRSIADLKGELDPVAVGEIEAVLNLVEQGHFYPTLILPEMAWTYQDVFPEKDYPTHCQILVPQNAHHELDPLVLVQRLEELRYLFRRFPEVFELYCRSMLLVVNSPHNPTAVVYRRETVLKLLQIAEEYGLTILDDNSYHKLIFSERKAREGDDCLAQVYEKYRSHFARPVRVITVSATTKGLEGAGDRTGLLHSNVPEAVEYAERRASGPHLMSLYLTQLKLESGLAAKRTTREVERIAAELVDPTATGTPQEKLRALLEEALGRVEDETFSVVVFETLLGGYEELLRLEQRGATARHLSECLSGLVKGLKQLRLERRLRTDVEKRVEQCRLAFLRAAPDRQAIEPHGAFYYCVRLCDGGDVRGIRAFLQAASEHRKADVIHAGDGFVRLSLGGSLAGDRASYDRLGQAIETYVTILRRYWDEFDRAGRDPAALPRIFAGEGGDELERLVEDLLPLLAAHGIVPRPADAPAPKRAPTRSGFAVSPSEKGVVYCIEEGRSVADKVFVQTRGCETVDELLGSEVFRLLYRRLLKKVYRREARLADLSFDRVVNRYGPLACQAAYHDRHLIDDVFRQLMRALYDEWHGASTIKVLAVRLEARRYEEKVAALQGISDNVNRLVNELMHAFELPEARTAAPSSFEIGYEELDGVKPHAGLPPYLKAIVSGCTFAGATTALNPMPSATTGATKRVSDYRYGFIRRDGSGDVAGRATPGLDFFRRRLDAFAELAELGHYVCKAVQVGPFRMLLVIHRSCFHLISDELRLFPQIEAVQLKENLKGLDWDGVLLFGLPAKIVGDSYKTGYILDRKAGGALLPTAWVAREDATDYVGFLKKSLLTLHNEQVKALGGLPVHGAMITITFKNGLRKTLVFSADSGAGKSETITALMEQMISGKALAAEVRKVDILAGDMLSIWRGEDRQLYAFGTETGDFMRLTDITEGWKARYGDLLKKGSYSNLDHPKNPRVTIPGICDRKKLLRPTRVNGFFYINNYEGTRGNAVEVSEDAHHVLKHVLVRGLRKNKGTAGDQPTLRAGLELAEETALVTRYRHAVDDLLAWDVVPIGGRERTCLVFRDGAGDVYLAREIVSAAFKGKRFRQGGQERQIYGVEYDLMQNLFWLLCEGRQRVVLDREVYDQIYEPLVSTFCGNPFVDPEGMDRTLGLFADAMRGAKVHTGVIKTQLAREGYEFSGPAKAALDIIEFLLEDEEVNARFQRNKDAVHQAMRKPYGGLVEAGANLPVDLEGYNLLLLEEHESTHVAFLDAEGRPFTLATPYYRYDPASGVARGSFRPGIALPDQLAAIRDICANRDYAVDLGELDVDLGVYDPIRFWNSIEELTYQVLLVNGVINLGSSELELARFPLEVRKARHVAERILQRRRPEETGSVVQLRAHT